MEKSTFLLRMPSMRNWMHFKAYLFLSTLFFSDFKNSNFWLSYRAFSIHIFVNNSASVLLAWDSESDFSNQPDYRPCDWKGPLCAGIDQYGPLLLFAWLVRVLLYQVFAPRIKQWHTVENCFLWCAVSLLWVEIFEIWKMGCVQKQICFILHPVSLKMHQE